MISPGSHAPFLGFTGILYISLGFLWPLLGRVGGGQFASLLGSKQKPVAGVEQR